MPPGLGYGLIGDPLDRPAGFSEADVTVLQAFFLSRSAEKLTGFARSTAGIGSGPASPPKS